MKTDEYYMEQCINLALKGIGNVAPNPMVGSVIVHNDTVIGEGYHEKYGQAHAEVNAINAVKDKSLLEKSTIYVNLEPCAHFGKTPPCSDLIISSKIPRVVIGCVDSYSEVSGKGIAKMLSAGIDVRVGVMESESLELNRRFFTYHNKQRPYIILKWAQSKDGYIDIKRAKNEKGIFWITQPETKKLVHQWRHEEAGILVGSNTIRIDNPELTCRDYDGTSPTRFVIDQKLRLDYPAFKVGDRKNQTYILTEKQVISNGKLQFLSPENFSIKAILKKIYTLEIQSLIVEGGAFTIQKFLDENIWDEARILTGIRDLKDGVKAPTIKGTIIKNIDLDKDKLTIIRND
ncbi:bifunctional diaminohydroxyphosphoribosylaminopyrimidine deaminase/5-amino-6-(5-phosphoribosylamino)uracil reductase RibD [Crocinitomix algicola]|uniref:bifunctional diaminohydroxyphosphoribosylaminopyrimidine deaminase/5-amino-6-(5-phosphoribosylamino)uracil reductase RibD n=1 Tax=Crocinitomix algicola TaxID=1740263 RepID=UPI000837A567|nr:bifunctional diaminohydroxyphosphoribosylaminopyrimidine deaminase/5-amino-6-(5-phosphoribosylamino)uracil reductase RibD [Crocinitomix algicola]